MSDYDAGLRMFRNDIKNIREARVRAKNRGDEDRVNELTQEENRLMVARKAFKISHKKKRLSDRLNTLTLPTNTDQPSTTTTTTTEEATRAINRNQQSRRMIVIDEIELRPSGVTIKRRRTEQQYDCDRASHVMLVRRSMITPPISTMSTLRLLSRLPADVIDDDSERNESTNAILLREVYLMVASDESESGFLYKIGVSHDPAQRAKQLQCGNAYTIAVAWTSDKYSSTEAFRVERQLHQHYATSHVRGEWFRFEGDRDDVIANVSQAASDLVSGVQQQQ